jgi:putative phosphoesterase
MKIGIFADVHDHLHNLREAVRRFNEEQVELVLFAGDLVSTISVPPLRKLRAPFVGCFGDNEGNKVGLIAGFRIIGRLSEPPVFITIEDGTRFVITHIKSQLRGVSSDYDVAVYGHTHKPAINRDPTGRIFINPGETSGWSFGRPTIAVFNSENAQASILELSTTSCLSGSFEGKT